ncbi:MFS transporter [Floricoccus tropicus]|uniref:MFS transporter n=1 Tax=Floricoccus tropicus TaxID=1859473 RepID=A0A1E8GKX1_9LACT|nr:MFS transporter [Floricoccus tropicus]
MVQKNSTSKEIIILITVCIFVLMSTLDSSIVNIALPTICKELNITQSQGSLIVSSYLLVICCSLLPFGKLGDLYGKSKVFKIGGIIFVLGSLLCGISTSLPMLIGARVVQAIGSGMTMSTNNGIITEAFPANQRGKALGTVGAFVSIGAIAGPGLGGLILNSFTWHYIFLINIPIGIIAIIASFLVLPKNHPAKNTQLDYNGAITLSAVILSFYGFITLIQDKGITNILTLACLVICILTFYLFIKVENSIDYPLINLSLFKNKLFTGSLISAFLVFISAFFYTMIMPFYLQEVRGYNPSKAGLIMMVFPLIQIVFSPIAGALADKYNKQRLTFFGLVLLAIGQLLYSFWGIDTSIIVVIMGIAVSAFGNTLFQAPNNTIIMSSVEPKDLGIAGALNALSRNLGMVLGVAISTLVLNFSVDKFAGHHMQSITENSSYFVSAMHVTFLISLTICVLAIFFNGMNQVKNKK